MEAIIKITNLSKRYYSKVALTDISVDFNRGLVYGLLGPNGSGKTTLMKVIAGLHKESSGEVLINENKLSYRTKADVVYMPTDDYLHPQMKVKLLINYFEDMYRDFDRHKAEAIISKLKLDFNLKVSELSTGMKGRLKVALAISRDASAYLFDEPLNGLDPISREIVLDLIIETIREDKVVVISSHLVNEIEKCLDKVVFIKDGFIELNEEAEDLRMKHGKSIEELYKEVYTC